MQQRDSNTCVITFYRGACWIWTAQSFPLNVCWGEAGVRPSITLHYKTMLQTANAANNPEPVHSPQLSNAFHMDLKKLIRNSLLGKVLKKKQQVKKSSEPRPSQTTLQEEQQSSDSRETRRDRKSYRTNELTSGCKRQSTSKNPSCRSTLPSPRFWSQTQPIPSISTKASGTMVAETMGSVSIPEDSSVRKVEQTVASNITLPRLPLI